MVLPLVIVLITVKCNVYSQFFTYMSFHLAGHGEQGIPFRNALSFSTLFLKQPLELMSVFAFFFNRVLHVLNTNTSTL